VGTIVERIDEDARGGLRPGAPNAPTGRSAIGGRYEGTIKDAQIDGTWTQGPQSFPLTLKRQPR